MKDIFDISDVSDLPEDLAKQLKNRDTNKLDSISTKLLELFEMSSKELNVDQVMAAMYRKFNINKPRKYWVAKLYNTYTRKETPIVKTGRGLYAYKFTKRLNGFKRPGE